MLGEAVDVQFAREVGAPVAPGDILGSSEGFKAVSNLCCGRGGTCAGGNPQAIDDPKSLAGGAYAAGWLYEGDSEPDSRCPDAVGCQALLDATTDPMRAKQKGEADLP